MNDIALAFIYVVCGTVGAIAHWGKKRYVDKTTNDTFKQYMLGNLPSTVYSLGAMAFAEISLSLTVTPPIFGLSQMIGALTLGYTFDSGINKSSESGIVKEVVQVIEDKK